MIYFIRHGQTDWNVQRKLQGRADIPLNQTGIAQAKQMGEKLWGIHFDKVFCSPLTRAQQTCKLVCGDREIVIDERLLERNFGEYEGIHAVQFKDFGFWNINTPQKFESAETLQEVIDRVYDFLKEITAKYKGQNVLIVAHGGVGMVLQSYFLGAPADGDYYVYLVHNGEVATFEN